MKKTIQMRFSPKIPTREGYYIVTDDCFTFNPFIIYLYKDVLTKQMDIVNDSNDSKINQLYWGNRISEKL